jgi:hypothetical protein
MAEIVWKCSWLFLMKFYKENTYSNGRDMISIRRPLQEFLALAPTAILTVLFCNLNNFSLTDELPQGIIPYFITE